MSPSISQTFDVGERWTTSPGLFVDDFIWEVCQSQLLLETIDFVIANSDLKRLNVGHVGLNRWSLGY